MRILIGHQTYFYIFEEHLLPLSFLWDFSCSTFDDGFKLFMSSIDVLRTIVITVFYMESFLNTYVQTLLVIFTPPCSPWERVSYKKFHRRKLPDNCSVFTVVMVIYYYIDIIGEFLLPPFFSYNIYDHQKYYSGEPVSIHIQSLINIIQDNNLLITTKNM